MSNVRISSGHEYNSTMFNNAIHIAKSSKKEVLSKDYNKLLIDSLSDHPSTKLIASIAKLSSWMRIWNLTLDKGKKGTRLMQHLFKELSCTCVGERSCKLCNLNTEENCFEHVCRHHPDFVSNLSYCSYSNKLRKLN